MGRFELYNFVIDKKKNPEKIHSPSRKEGHFIYIEDFVFSKPAE